ncbi:MAG: hypothetical protein MUF85_03220 [Patescibacteria group bacterium]|jgi:hypothetical protein|nr:hypothetical protein [Patescibacteria group bacterium]
MGDKLATTKAITGEIIVPLTKEILRIPISLLQKLIGSIAVSNQDAKEK